MQGRTSAYAALALLTLSTACGSDPGGRTDTVRPRSGDVRACPTGNPDPRGLPTRDGDGSPMNTPEARALADAVAPPKRGTGQNAAYYDIYSSMTVDRPPGRVALCVTDPARGRDWVAAAAKAHPGVDFARLDLYRGRWSAKEVQAAGARVLSHAGQYGFPIRTLSQDGATGLTVGTTPAGAASRDFRTRLAGHAGTVAVRVRAVGEILPVEGTAGMPLPKVRPR
ncbi:hypothetical protein ACIQM4_10155 [Streptomyces sp. NPDC091272]|uniref:hypothetical protein n=1 Tax=Streptomyces sp. NPDC091272 TaxID=3365981 RepID=UPI0037F3A140